MRRVLRQTRLRARERGRESSDFFSLPSRARPEDASALLARIDELIG